MTDTENLLEKAIRLVEIKRQGRTRYEGQKPFPDELLVDEIYDLREQVEFLKAQINTVPERKPNG